MRPVVFKGIVGWLHPAQGRRGVLIAGAQGFEDLCTRAFLTRMAREIAARGLPVMQFDYTGCGDASGDHTAPSLVASWKADIGAAIDRLKAETGVEDVIVLALRIGAMLAPSALQGREDVAGLALLAPPPSGKTYVRELTGLSRMIDGALPPHDDAGDAFEGIEVAGFRLTPETVADLRSLDWQSDLEAAGIGDMLLMPAAMAPAMTGLAERLSASGAAVAVDLFAGYNMLMCDPTANEMPQPVLDRTCDWIAARAVAGGAAPEALPAGSLEAEAYWEQPVAIGGGSEICGVLCQPAGGGQPDEVTLFLNAGAVPHIGWARGTVEAARALAAEGRASLRIDLPGLGQSEPSPQKRLYLYDTRTGEDIGRVVDWLEESGFRHINVSGTCSGGYQAFHAARADRRIERLVMVNPLCFAWNSSYALDMNVWKAYESSKVALGKDRTTTSGNASEAASPDRERRGPGWRGIASKKARRSVRLAIEMVKSAVTDLSPARLISGRSVERWMAELTAHGTKVLVVDTEGDLSIEEIARHFGPEGGRLKRLRGVTTRRLIACDHTVTPRHAREMLTRHLLEFLDSHAGPVFNEPAATRTQERLHSLRQQHSRT